MIDLTVGKRVARLNGVVLACAFAVGAALTMSSSASGQMDCRFWKNAAMYGGTCIGGGGGCGICIDTISAARAKTSSCVSSKSGEVSCRQPTQQVALMSLSLDEERLDRRDFVAAGHSIVPGQVVAQKTPACRGGASLFDAVDPRKQQTASPTRVSMPAVASVPAELFLGP